MTMKQMHTIGDTGSWTDGMELNYVFLNIL